MQAGESGFTPELLRQLTTQAADAADHAYAPYSKFRVGAALLLQNGALVTGANVENASYGLTICAERSAVVPAVAEHGPEMRVLACAITNLNQAASPPCGACLQVLSEFMLPASRVIFRGQSDWEDYRFEEVFPHRFKLQTGKEGDPLGTIHGFAGVGGNPIPGVAALEQSEGHPLADGSLGTGAAVDLRRTGIAL